MMSPHDRGAAASESPARVFISYAHESVTHMSRVRDLWVFLRGNGVDATLDLPATDRRRDWASWMLDEVRDADFVLVVASSEYRRRAEGSAPVEVGRGVAWEAALIREEVYSNRQAAVAKFIPVLLPGATTDDIPAWLGPNTGTSYRISDFSLAGAEDLLRLLTRQPHEVPIPVGPRPVLPTRVARQEVSSVAPLYRIFLHFFDPHFLDQVGRGRNFAYIAGEARRATRLAVLAAHTVFVPAASYLESDLCAATVNEYRSLFDTGLITLVGGEANLVDFALSKLLQYEPGSDRYRKYESMLDSVADTPPFRSRRHSATADITAAWRQRLGDLSMILDGVTHDVRSLAEVEKRWENVPAALDGRAFTPEYVARVLFEPEPAVGAELIIARRAGATVNSAYFASYTTELNAGVVTELTYLHSPDSGSAASLDLPFGSLVRALESHGVADRVFGARSERLIELRSNPDVVAAIVETVRSQTPTDRLVIPTEDA